MTPELRELLERAVDLAWLEGVKEVNRDGKPVYPREIFAKDAFLVKLISELTAAGYAVVPIDKLVELRDNHRELAKHLGEAAAVLKAAEWR